MHERLIDLDGVKVNDDSPCYIIAEIGNNHQGNLETCKKLIASAKKAGANSVKLQKRSNKDLYMPSLYDANYENKNSYGNTYGEHREFLEFGNEEYKELIQFSKDQNITFFSTAFDFESFEFLEKLDMPLYKIASGDLLSIPLIKEIAKTNKPLIVSTGGADIDDVKRVYDEIMPINNKLVILQCTAAYPPIYEEMNLNVIETYRKMFSDITIGLSSHDSGIALDLIAYMLGARVIEKHFTLNRANKGTDHSFSLEPQGLEKLVRDLDRTIIALGDGQKRKYPSEEKPLFKMGKKLVFNKALKKGDMIRPEDIDMRSPNDGLPPYFLHNFTGKILKKNIEQWTNLSFDQI